MGCGGSRLKNGDSIPAKFRPILRRRIEEVQRRRRMGSTKDESAKKELLLANDFDERKSNVSNVTKGDDYTAFSSPVRAVEEPKPDKKRDMKEKNERDTKGEKEKDGGNRKSNTGVTDLDGDADDNDVRDDASIFCPGSPSFRIYFVDNGDHSNDDDEHCLETVKEVVVEEKLHTVDVDPLPEKESETKPMVKRVRKKRSLKMVIPRGGQAAVKNLLNVKACVTPTRHDRAHLLSEKTQP